MRKTTNIILAVVTSVALVFMFDIVIDYFLYERPVGLYAEPCKPFHLIWACVITPFTEEMVFREVPYKLFKPGKDREFIFMVFIGIIFGWLHGTYINIFTQGIAGIAFGWVYLRNGYSYMSAVVTHAIYNFMVGFAIPILIS